MAQTGTTLGHAHLYEEGDAFTGPFDGHTHSLPSIEHRTGSAVNIETGEPTHDHFHTLPTRIDRDVKRSI